MALQGLSAGKWAGAAVRERVSEHVLASTDDMVGATDVAGAAAGGEAKTKRRVNPKKKQRLRKRERRVKEEEAPSSAAAPAVAPSSCLAGETSSQQRSLDVQGTLPAGGAEPGSRAGTEDPILLPDRSRGGEGEQEGGLANPAEAKSTALRSQGKDGRNLLTNVFRGAGILCAAVESIPRVTSLVASAVFRA